MQTLREDIPYDLIKRIINDCPISRTKALIAFQYATGCRIGELLSYTHKKVSPAAKKKAKKHRILGEPYCYKPEDHVFPETKGLLKEMVKTEESEEFGMVLTITLDNFKASGINSKIAFVVEKREKWLFDLLLDWVNSLPEHQDKVFTVRRSRASGLVDKELKKYHGKYSTHYLRHSRLTHLNSIYGWNVYEIMDFAGHTSIKPSSAYVHVHKKDVLRKFIKKDGIGE